MHAKPIVDIMLGLESFPAPTGVCARLCSLGYEALGEADLPGRLYFRKRLSTAFNVQAVLLGGPLWNDNLLLGNFLPPILPKRDIMLKRNNVLSKRGTELSLLTLRSRRLSSGSCLLLRSIGSKSPDHMLKRSKNCCKRQVC
jgi:GrpB protein